jgi:CheY-like chemotaxis protein
MATVLVVDDEPDILLMLRVALESSGHTAVLAPDGEAGLQRLREQAVDCVLLDVMMPVMDGWGVLGAVKQLADPPPVVVISAKSGEQDVQRAFELGAVDYVTKPFSPFALVSLVEEVAGMDEAARKAHRASKGYLG